MLGRERVGAGSRVEYKHVGAHASQAALRGALDAASTIGELRSLVDMALGE